MGRSLIASRVFAVACSITFIAFCLWQLIPRIPYLDGRITLDPSTGVQQVVADSKDAAPPSADNVALPSSEPISTSTYFEVVTSTSHFVETPTPSFEPIFVPNAGPHRFPKKIWHKSGPQNVDTETMKWVQTWANKNPTYRQEILTDATADTFVLEYFADHPEILYAYFTIAIPILRADLLRYLILFAEGGIWSDLDAECLVPVDNWIPHQFHGQEVNLVVGMEFDFGFRNDGVLHGQFNSWSVMAKPRSRHMKAIISYVISNIQREATEHNVQLRDYTMGMVSDVVDVSGPKAMTLAIFSSLEEMLGEKLDDRNISSTKLKEPVLLGDVLILPGAAMAASQNEMPEDEGEYLVSHHYSGSWKNQNKGENN